MLTGIHILPEVVILTRICDFSGVFGVADVFIAEEKSYAGSSMNIFLKIELARRYSVLYNY